MNVKNNDEQCFKWAVLAAVFPAKYNGERISWYTKHEQDLDWTGLTFPVTLPDIEKFERRNEISINVYGCSCNTHLGKWKNGDEWLLSKTGSKEQKKAILNARRENKWESCSPYILRKSDLIDASRMFQFPAGTTYARYMHVECMLR